eukprot:5960449-Pyramimonas_sp.AAC.1
MRVSSRQRRARGRGRFRVAPARLLLRGLVGAARAALSPLLDGLEQTQRLEHRAREILGKFLAE